MTTDFSQAAAAHSAAIDAIRHHALRVEADSGGRTPSAMLSGRAWERHSRAAGPA